MVGGAICLCGEALSGFYRGLVSTETAKMLVSVTLIFLSCLATGLGLYGRIARFAGAGTLVPITGFANAVCSPAIDARAEGFIPGVGTKMFVIAGPVIVYGTVSAVLYGVIYYTVRFLLPVL